MLHDGLWTSSPDICNAAPEQLHILATLTVSRMQMMRQDQKLLTSKPGELCAKHCCVLMYAHLAGTCLVQWLLFFRRIIRRFYHGACITCLAWIPISI